MYDVISAIINHAWQTNYTGDQTHIYNICAAMICILTVAFVDAIRAAFSSFLRK